MSPRPLRVRFLALGIALPVAISVLLAVGALPLGSNPSQLGTDSSRILDAVPPAASADVAAPGAELAAETEFADDAGHADDRSAGALAALQSELARHLARGAGRTGNWGVLAVSGARGDTLFAQNHGASLAPASNQKLLTSAGALYHLGPDFRFTTFLLADGTVSNGRLHGDLILYGTGDPALSDRLLESEVAPFREFARELRRQGVRTVTGDILGDGTFFTGPTRRDSWNPRDLNDWFAAPVSGLSFNENVVTLRVQASAPGTAPRVRTQPEGALLPLANQGRTVAGGVRTPLMVVRDDPDAPIEIRGEMAPGQADAWRRITVSDPPAFAASILKRVLREEGIRVEGSSGSVRDASESRVTGTRLVAPAFQGVGDEGAAGSWDDGSSVGGTRTAGETWTVAVHHSPPVRDLLDVVNKRSHNLYAEALLLAMGRTAWGDGSFDGGSGVLTRYLTRVVQLDSDGLNVVDGSGLSRLNRARPSDLVTLLAHMDRDEHADAFWASLPEAGNQRELRRMYRSAAAGNLRAKTGTIHRVSALSGVVRTLDGEPIYFSIVANDVPSPWAAKQVEDRIGIQLAAFTRPFDPELPASVRYAGRGTEVGEGAAATAQDGQQDR